MNCQDFEAEVEALKKESEQFFQELNDVEVNSNDEIEDYYDLFEDLMEGNKAAFKFEDHEKDLAKDAFDPINVEANIISANANPEVILGKAL